MLADKDIDVHVAEARALAARLNGILDVLKSSGVDCVSVIGLPPSSYEATGVRRDLSRVSLVLDFRPTRKREDGDA